MSKYFLSAILLFALVSFTSCKEKNDCEAGLGGSVTLLVYPKHHSKTILSQANYPDTVFIKYNTQESPGNSAGAYDTYFVGEEGEDHIHCAGLKCGDYYLYTVGYDTSIAQRVYGGLPYTIDESASGEKVINPFPVAE